jgi:hypothetical protein
VVAMAQRGAEGADGLVTSSATRQSGAVGHAHRFDHTRSPLPRPHFPADQPPINLSQWLLRFRLRVPRWHGHLARGFESKTQQIPVLVATFISPFSQNVISVAPTPSFAAVGRPPASKTMRSATWVKGSVLVAPDPKTRKLGQTLWLPPLAPSSGSLCPLASTRYGFGNWARATCRLSAARVASELSNARSLSVRIRASSALPAPVSTSM